jgi:hypothetical protein
MIAPEVLLESKAARNGQLTQFSHEAASDVLSKAKALVFALWQGTGAATTQQMAEYYEVPVDAVESVLRRHKNELKPDGVITLKGNQLKTFKQLSAKLTESNAGSMTVWKPRAALRLGMLLRDSEVAKQVRNVLLDVAQTAEPRNTGDSQAQTDIAQMIELAKTQIEVINEQQKMLAEQQKMLATALANLGKTKAKDKKQPKWTPRSTSHLIEFVREVGLEYQPDGQVYVSDLWQQLRDWYIKTGVLKVETLKGKEKLTWRDLPNKRDNPVKAINQLSRRLCELFPKLQRRRHTGHDTGHDGKSRLGCSYLIGIGYAQNSELSGDDSYD